MKLDQAMLLAHWGLPLLVVTFVLVYWVLGILNYISPNIETIMAKEKEEMDEDEEGSLYMILGILGLGSGLLMVLGWFLYPRVIIKMQELKGKDVVQSIK